MSYSTGLKEGRSEDMRPTLTEFQQFLEDVFSMDIRNSSKKKQNLNKTTATTTIHTRRSQSPNLHLLSSVVKSFQEYLYENTEGWAFSYADLRPASERNFMGHVFLATNLAYVLAGSALLLEKDYLLGCMTELCAVASFQYHFQQLQQPYQRAKDEAVRVALTIDYVTALSSIGIGIAYLVQDHSLPSGQLLATATTGLVFLLLGWIWEEGLPYVVLHSCWHIFSAATAYLVGTTHISNYPHSGM
ncbi:hypothetical protein IV203_017194 [Nitzschia inconspicua]|uniref:Uncharacterized protein n=1 Tax=Nitzschia inconspicua TaxID=303405 RepID=A0A9K3KSG7_9STRA|nr:hypothetical protein IV203_017194 [Nitzschia inconspicua]